jgi:hypothetical protein
VTDEELLAQVRIRAFEGLLITVMLTDECPIKQGMTGRFNEILGAVDDLTALIEKSEENT